MKKNTMKKAVALVVLGLAIAPSIALAGEVQKYALDSRGIKVPVETVYNGRVNVR